MQPPFTFTYPLNGHTARHTVNMGRGPQQQLTKAVRVRETILIATQYLPNPADGLPLIAGMTQVLSLESPETLVIETTRSVADRRGSSSITRTVYQKKKP